MDFSWAETYPEVLKVCKLFGLTELSSPIKYNYRQVEQITQEGPQCGPVALSMFLKDDLTQKLNDIVDTAKSKEYSYSGEICSVYDMAALAAEYLPQAKVDIYQGSLDCPKVKNLLLAGGVMLVPFDIDKDKTPGLYKGHKAHWAAVCGGILTKGGFFVFARHGSARNVAVWKIESLAASNEQLFEFSPERTCSEVPYKLPEGGIGGPLGLNKKSVFINFS